MDKENGKCPDVTEEVNGEAEAEFLSASRRRIALEDYPKLNGKGSFGVGKNEIPLCDMQDEVCATELPSGSTENDNEKLPALGTETEMNEARLEDGVGQRKTAPKLKVQLLREWCVLLLSWLRSAVPYIVTVAVLVLTLRSVGCKGLDGNSYALIVISTFLLARSVCTLLSYSTYACRVAADVKSSVCTFLTLHGRRVKITLLVISTIGAFVIVCYVGVQRAHNLISLLGIALLILASVACSRHPTKINWSIVVTGLFLQLFFATSLIFWTSGRSVLDFVGNRTATFLSFSQDGAMVVFGPVLYDHFFAFVLMPSVVFFGAITSLLYHWGIAQRAIHAIANVIQHVMGTSPAESIAAATNIFIGNSETLMALKPILNDVTRSELHSLLTSGFATVSGSAFAAYVGLGVPPQHLIVASFMSAPAALAISKIMMPETTTSPVDKRYLSNMSLGTFKNGLHALACGAVSSIPMIANIAVSVLTFTSIMGFVDAVLMFIGDRLCFGVVVTFKGICSYIFWPIAFIIGIRPEDCLKVGQLLGLKVFLNEFMAYEMLGGFMKHRQEFLRLASTKPFSCNDTGVYFENKTLVNDFMSPRTEDITTYALCGFSNICCLGIYIGAFAALAPSRQPTVSKLVTRSLVAGNVACYLTAAIASLLVANSDVAGDYCSFVLNLSTFNSSSNSTSINNTFV